VGQRRLNSKLAGEKNKTNMNEGRSWFDDWRYGKTSDRKKSANSEA